jgi:hypothetical protein
VKQVTWPAFAWYAPGGQLMHEVRPMPFVYEPAAQALLRYLKGEKALAIMRSFGYEV